MFPTPSGSAGAFSCPFDRRSIQVRLYRNKPEEETDEWRNPGVKCLTRDACVNCFYIQSVGTSTLRFTE